MAPTGAPPTPTPKCARQRRDRCSRAEGGTRVQLWRVRVQQGAPRREGGRAPGHTVSQVSKWWSSAKPARCVARLPWRAAGVRPPLHARNGRAAARRRGGGRRADGHLGTRPLEPLDPTDRADPAALGCRRTAPSPALPRAPYALRGRPPSWGARRNGHAGGGAWWARGPRSRGRVRRRRRRHAARARGTGRHAGGARGGAGGAPGGGGRRGRWADRR
jgi:hypothetical protein